MSGPRENDLLARDIAAALTNKPGRISASRSLLLMGIAIACLQPLRADALGLGDIQIKSALGQPLVGVTTARIKPGETLSSGCITSAASSQGAMTNVSDLQVTVPETSAPGEHMIRLTSRQPLYEPMYEIRLQVKCPGGMSFARDYIVMLNLPMTSPAKQLTAAPAPQNAPSSPEQNVRQPAAAVGSRRPAAIITVAAPTPDTTNRTTPATNLRPYTERFATPTAPIAAGTEYRVRAGDTLSTIAQRIAGRPAGTTYEVADQIFGVNQAAFVDSNPDLIKLGSVIRIPAADEMLASAPVAAPDSNSLVAPVPEPTTAALVQDTGVQPTQTVAADLPVSSLPAATEQLVSTASDSPLANDLDVPAAPGILPVVRDMAADAVPAATDEELRAAEAGINEDTILIDSSLLDDSAFMDEPFEVDAELAAAAPAVITAVETDNLVNQPAANAQPAKVHPLLAAGLGALLGCLIAALMMGRKIVARLLPARAARDPRTAIEELNARSAEQPARNIDFQGVDTDVSNTAETEYPETPATEQASPAIAAADQMSADDGAADQVPADDTAETPRISLKDTATMEFDLAAQEAVEATEKFATPDFSIDGERPSTSELDGTNTMRKLFSEELEEHQAEAANDAELAVTVELPELDDQLDIERTSDLQSISEIADSGTIDDKLSQTLTQALDLLEQDYEEEFSSSQILEQREINDAFTALKKK